jgi:hypothetical protein
MPHPYHHPTFPEEGHAIESASGSQTVFAKKQSGFVRSLMLDCVTTKSHTNFQ